MAKNNMGISDAEFPAAAKALVNYANDLERMMNNYVGSVKIICNDAIEDQAICGKLTALAERVNELKTPLNSIVDTVQEHCKQFLKEIDDADKFMY